MGDGSLSRSARGAVRRWRLPIFLYLQHLPRWPPLSRFWEIRTPVTRSSGWSSAQKGSYTPRSALLDLRAPQPHQTQPWPHRLAARLCQGMSSPPVAGPQQQPVIAQRAGRQSGFDRETPKARCPVSPITGRCRCGPMRRRSLPPPTQNRHCDERPGH